MSNTAQQLEEQYCEMLDEAGQMKQPLNNTKAWHRGFVDGYQDYPYDNPYDDHSDEDKEYKDGWYEGRMELEKEE
jgi:hypothetical protein